MNKKLKKCYRMAAVVAVISLSCTVPAFATGTAADPLAIVNNLSDVIFSIIKVSAALVAHIVSVGVGVLTHGINSSTGGKPYNSC